MKYSRTACYHAFSLVELSIVLVILGLLVGGVLSGRSLIRASELRAITTERDRFVSAIYAFRDKYFQLPGDLSNAYQFWGATCGTNTMLASTGCNGDGNGVINMLLTGESAKAWEHLARAGMIEGNYDGTGVNLGHGDIAMDEKNAPTSKYPNGRWYVGDDGGEAAREPTATLGGNLFMIFGGSSVASAYPQPISRDGGFSLTRGNAWSVDKKSDDGFSNTGKIRGEYNGSGCYETGGSAPYGTNAAGGPDADDCSLTFILN